MDSSHYRIVKIPKRSGGTRTLEIPEPGLMTRQRQILAWLKARKLAASPYAHGFIIGRSIVTNAQPHVGKKVVIRLDLKDFFPSVGSSMVTEVLMSSHVSAEVTREVIQVCTLEERLPQGAPTSPFLANLTAVRLDYRLAGLAHNWRGGSLRTDYTRYADDLTFSSDDRRLNHIVPIVQGIIEGCGFRMNRKKTRIYRRGGRQIVAGVIVNDRPNVSRTVRRNLRAEIHQLQEAILRGHRLHVDIERLRGLAAHIRSVNAEEGGKFSRDVVALDNLRRVVMATR